MAVTILSTQTYVQMVFQMEPNWDEILVNGPGMVAYAFDPNTLEAEEADLCELQANQSYIVLLAVPKDPG